jgi:glycosyltransferase involved in cell wall biosynthesis
LVDAAIAAGDRSMSKRPLRVLVVDQARGVWGAQRYLLRLAPLVRELGVELTLAGPRSLELHDAWLKAGFDAVDLDVPIDRSIRTSGRPRLSGVAREAVDGLRVARLIADIARGGGHDAIWANAHWIHVDASVAGRICGRPVVLHLHEESVPGLGQWLRACAVRVAPRTVAVSQAVADGLPHFARKRVCVIPNGVDTEAMSPPSDAAKGDVRRLRASFGIGTDDVMVLAATRLDPSKRIEDLIATVRAVDNPRVRLVVAGATSGYPDYERDVRAAASTLPAGHINFCGIRDDMTALFRASDVVLHAGMVEGMPLGLLEAQSCGKPVIAYDVAGVPEAVLDGSTGLLAAPCDVVGLSVALSRLAGDPALRAQMGTAARTHVLAHHRIETQAMRNVAVLTEMCDVAGAMAV